MTIWNSQGSRSELWMCPLGNIRDAITGIQRLITRICIVIFYSETFCYLTLSIT
jgi:hypothetical protein